MPELPEVETVCRGLAQALAGLRLTDIDQRRKDLRTPIPPRLGEKLAGHRVAAVTRRAKYIQMLFDDGQALLLHLGMSGRMKIMDAPQPPGKHDHLIFHFKGGTTVAFNDPRRFGACDWVKQADTLPHHKWLRHLGVEPLEKGFNPDYLLAAFKTRKTAVKLALMDQAIVVGVGNIYASESLFQAGIDPRRAAGSLKPKELEKLVPAVQKVLRAAIAAGGSTLRDYRQADGGLGYFQHQFAVYDRAGETCPGCTCTPQRTGGIQRLVQGGRSTFFCTTKQK